MPRGGRYSPPQQGAVLCPAVTMTQTTAIDIRAGDGNDQLIKSDLSGPPGNKFNSLRFVGEDGDDFAAASDGEDTLSGGHGGDILSGKGGDDFIVGDLDDGVPGDDNIFGGAGADRIAPGSGNDVIDGGAGFDRVEYSNLKTGLNFAVTAKNLKSVEVLVGTPEGDTITNKARYLRSIKTGSGDDKIGGGPTSARFFPDRDRTTSELTGGMTTSSPATARSTGSTAARATTRSSPTRRTRSTRRAARRSRSSSARSRVLQLVG